MDIVKEVEKFTLHFFEERISSSFVYHSVEHTKLVVSAAQKIAEAEGLDQMNQNIVVTAAWFHDIGYAISCKNHEEESCKIAVEFLNKKGIDKVFIDEVLNCIKSTKMGAERNTLIEKVISDADHAHTGMENFMELSNLYRKELVNISENKITKLDYWKKTYEFLNRISFLTQSAKENFEETKNKNIIKVEKRIKKLEGDKIKKEKKNPEKSTTRGVETLFRLTARNQINLSSIADNKANIMLTINSVLLSVVVSTSALNSHRELSFLIPVLVLVLTCLISLVFSILSVRPNISAGKFTDEDLKDKNVNLLFFGNFYDMDYSKYEEGVKMMMDDYDFLYGNLIKDQYNLGKVLSRKYKLLSFAYNFFMYGFIVAVLTFLGFMLLGI